MILFLRVLLFIYFLFCQNHLIITSDSDNLYRIHNLCKYFEFVSVYLEIIAKLNAL